MLRINQHDCSLPASVRPVVSVYPEKYPVRLHLHLTSFSLGRLPDDFPKDAEFVRVNGKKFGREYAKVVSCKNVGTFVLLDKGSPPSSVQIYSSSCSACTNTDNKENSRRLDVLKSTVEVIKCRPKPPPWKSYSSGVPEKEVAEKGQSEKRPEVLLEQGRPPQFPPHEQRQVWLGSIFEQGLPRPPQGQELLGPPYGQGLPRSPQEQESLRPSLGQGLLRSPLGQGLLRPPHGQMSLRSPLGQGLPRPSHGQMSLRSPLGQGLPRPSHGQMSLRSPLGQGLPRPSHGQMSLRSPLGQGSLRPPQGQELLRSPLGQGLLRPQIGQVLQRPPLGQGLQRPPHAQGFLKDCWPPQTPVGLQGRQQEQGWPGPPRISTRPWGYRQVRTEEGQYQEPPRDQESHGGGITGFHGEWQSEPGPARPEGAQERSDDILLQGPQSFKSQHHEESQGLHGDSKKQHEAENRLPLHRVLDAIRSLPSSTSVPGNNRWIVDYGFEIEGVKYIIGSQNHKVKRARKRRARLVNTGVDLSGPVFNGKGRKARSYILVELPPNSASPKKNESIGPVILDIIEWPHQSNVYNVVHLFKEIFTEMKHLATSSSASADLDPDSTDKTQAVQVEEDETLKVETGDDVETKHLLKLYVSCIKENKVKTELDNKFSQDIKLSREYMEDKSRSIIDCVNLKDDSSLQEEKDSDILKREIHSYQPDRYYKSTKRSRTFDAPQNQRKRECISLLRPNDAALLPQNQGKGQHSAEPRPKTADLRLDKAILDKGQHTADFKPLVASTDQCKNDDLIEPEVEILKISGVFNFRDVSDLKPLKPEQPRSTTRAIRNVQIVDSPVVEDVRSENEILKQFDKDLVAEVKKLLDPFYRGSTNKAVEGDGKISKEEFRYLFRTFHLSLYENLKESHYCYNRSYSSLNLTPDYKLSIQVQVNTQMQQILSEFRQNNLC